MTTPHPSPADPLDRAFLDRAAKAGRVLGPEVRTAATIADRVVLAVQQHGRPLDDHEEFWRRVALDALAEIRAYDDAMVAHGDSAIPDRVQLAATDDIRAWLDRPAFPGSTKTVATHELFDDTLHAGAEHLHQLLTWLLSAAQQEGLIGLKDHEFGFWTGGHADPDLYYGGLYLVIVAPSGPKLLSGWLDAPQLVGRGRGPDAAVQALANIAGVVDDMLADQDTTMLSIHRHLNRTAAAAVRAHAFPPVSTPPAPGQNPGPGSTEPPVTPRPHHNR